MKKINITITGALGKMGKILIKRIFKNKNLKLFSLTDIKSGKSINGIKTQKNNYYKICNYLLQHHPGDKYIRYVFNYDIEIDHYWDSAMSIYRYYLSK